MHSRKRQHLSVLSYQLFIIRSITKKQQNLALSTRCFWNALPLPTTYTSPSLILLCPSAVTTSHGFFTNTAECLSVVQVDMKWGKSSGLQRNVGGSEVSAQIPAAYAYVLAGTFHRPGVI